MQVMKEVKTNVDAAIVLAALQDQAKPILKQLAKVNISDNTTLELKASKVAALKALGKLAETKKASLIDPLKQVIKDINALFAPFETLVEEAEKNAKEDILAYDKKVETAKAKVQTNLAQGKIKKLSTATSKVAALEIVSASSSLRNKWVLEEIDANVTPVEYMVPDRAKILKAFKDGKKVLGWRYVQKKIVAI